MLSRLYQFIRPELGYQRNDAVQFNNVLHQRIIPSVSVIKQAFQRCRVSGIFLQLPGDGTDFPMAVVMFYNPTTNFIPGVFNQRIIEMEPELLTPDREVVPPQECAARSFPAQHPAIELLNFRI